MGNFLFKVRQNTKKQWGRREREREIEELGNTLVGDLEM
jgi:hypothetical protein